MHAETCQALTPIPLKNATGLAVQVLPFGGTIASIHWQGQPMTLSYPNYAQWQHDSSCMGSTAGRYANRIANARYQNSQGAWVQLAANQGLHTLHGGPQGFQYQTWQVESQSEQQVVLFLESADGDQGFPGLLQIWQTITLVENEVHISYHATTDRETVVNLTNHCYFNLGDGETLLDHDLQIFAAQVLPVDDAGIPTSLPVPVESFGGADALQLRAAKSQQAKPQQAKPEQDEPQQAKPEQALLDFRQPRKLDKSLQRSSEVGGLLHGLDHCFVQLSAEALSEWRFDSNKLSAATQPSQSHAAQLRLLARLRCGQRQLEVLSTQPGLQAYIGSYLNAPFQPYQGICLEAQNWPDAPNWPGFPSATLSVNQRYQQQIIYRFI
jgi:aldose 1-epimerase